MYVLIIVTSINAGGTAALNNLPSLKVCEQIGKAWVKIIETESGIVSPRYSCLKLELLDK